MKRILEILVVLLLMGLVVVNSGKFFGYDFAKQQPEATADPTLVTVDEARAVWNDATQVVLTTDGIYEVKRGSTLLGFLMKSAPYSDQISGYMGTVPLLIALDAEGRVCRVVPLENNETPAFFAMVTSSGLLEVWNGKGLAEAVAAEVDAVSGATYSSRAIIQGVRSRLAAVDHLEVSRSRNQWVLDSVLLLLVLLTLWAWLRPAKVGKIRRWILLGSVIIMGIWQGRMLSMAQFMAWLTGGIPLAAQWLMLVILLLAILLPMITGKAYYCAWLCPMGAAQSLLGDLNKKHKLKLPSALVKGLQILRTAILLFGLLMVALGWCVDFFANWEAFSIFRPQSAPIVALVLAIVSLVLSVFVVRPWCRFLCPLGELLEAVRRKPAEEK